MRGGLATVDDTASTFTVNVKPFDDHGTDRGTLTVHVNAQTAYEINGQTSTGTAGLAALKALAAGTMTAAFGSLQLSDKTFTATRVLAGTSLEAPDSDRLGGTVIARSGDTLTVRGATLGRRDGKVAFQASDITLKVGTGTTVTREGSTGGALTAAAISVGQRISAAGTASTDTAGKTTLDASAGSVRLGVTAAWGLVKTATAGTLTLTLQSLDGRPASVFNFAGTGNGAAQDANAANYRVGTGTLSLAALVAGKPARVYGFVTPFGSAPPDFSASALVDYSATLAVLDIEWKDGGATAPFSAMAASGLVVDKTNTLLADDSVRIGPQRIDLAALPAGVRIVAAGQSTDSFAIGTDQRQVTMYTSFGDFVTALTAKLNGSGKLRHLDAQGSYDSASNTFTASRLVVVVSGG
ncbi:MAG: hypothetical protein U1F11_05870 [Steroidobacteraceae bacterium]